jgi:hypothetical protein
MFEDDRKWTFDELRQAAVALRARAREICSEARRQRRAIEAEYEALERTKAETRRVWQRARRIACSEPPHD